MNKNDYCIGLDYGSDSVRALLVDMRTGEEVATATSHYQRWVQGLYCDAKQSQFRQHPQDYLDSLEEVIRLTLEKAPADAAGRVRAISTDTTGSTPVAVDERGTALALTDRFKENPNAMFVLWKDHTAVQEAAEINACARTWGGEDYTQYEGGIYSSEWFWAKILHCLRVDEAVRESAFSWVEHCDWLPAVLSGNTDPLTLKRSRCAAGHKALWHANWGGLPPDAFFARLDPLLAGLAGRLYTETFPADTVAGYLSADWAGKLGLPAGIPIGVGAFDCHMGAVGAGIRPGCLVKVMGTSTCDIAVSTEAALGDRLIPGICGQVDGSVLPGLVGLEAGQSAFGDVYAWFRDLVSQECVEFLERTPLLPADIKQGLIKALRGQILKTLDEKAVAVKPGESGILALDWLNGRRTPDADQTLAMAISGLKMGSDAVHIYRALVEATAFGSRRIMERFEAHEVPIESIRAIGGIARKSPFVMQVCADVLNRPIDVVASDQCCALGAAVFAATICGAYPTVAEAQAALGSPVCKQFTPDPARARIYDDLYAGYKGLGAFVEQTKRPSS